MSNRSGPTARPVIATFAIIAWIIAWAVLVASLSRFVGAWPILIQAAFYLIMGIVWIFPLKPLLRWSQTGTFAKLTGDDGTTGD